MDGLHHLAVGMHLPLVSFRELGGFFDRIGFVVDDLNTSYFSVSVPMQMESIDHAGEQFSIVDDVGTLFVEKLDVAAGLLKIRK